MDKLLQLRSNREDASANHSKKGKKQAAASSYPTMEASSLATRALASPFSPSPNHTKSVAQSPIFRPNPVQNHSHFPPISATLNSPRGFGPASKKTRKRKTQKKGGYNTDDEDDDEDDEEEGEREAGIIPEVVTNRMISRMGFSVGIPLLIGLMFFPVFYYLKVVAKVDVPTWAPFAVSFVFFGAALLGVSYGIVSSSWDPLRQGSVLGWKEAQKNWPVFWQSIWGRGSGKKR